MVVLGYDFVTLDDTQKKSRRHLLELYPFIAQISVLAVFALFQTCFFLSWILKRGLDYERPRSPSFTKRGDGSWTWLRKSRQGWDKMMWWMKKPVIGNWGTRGEWLGGGTWTIWLLYLCIVDTGNDYLHLTKRFGIIGASQLPLHYLLAMRSPYSPIQWLTRLSHEQLKASHQISGRIIYLLFALHAFFYMLFFALSGYLSKRLKDDDVIWGLISIALFTILSTTALQRLRRWNYRVFYISHVVIAHLVLVTLYFHVTHIRLYIMETMVVNMAHQVLRWTSVKTFSGTIKLLSGTNLVQIRIPLTSMNSALAWKPGQHVYLSRPSGKTASISDHLTFRNQTNPFTVASIPVKDKELLLVARTITGNTRKLADLAKSLSTDGSDQVPPIPLTLEGPYGASAHLPDFSTFDKVLLVAGGVGATFIVPIYRSIIEFHSANQVGGPQVRFIWAVKKLADTQWASFPSSPSPTSTESETTPSLHTPSAVEVYVTRPSGSAMHIADSGEEMELAELAENDELLSMEEQMEKPQKGMSVKNGRPKLPAIVDEVFSKGQRVAVVSCGPKTLTGKLAESVERWVTKGHDVQVFWHEETFAW